MNDAFPERGPDAGQAASYSFQSKTNARGHVELLVASTPPVPREVDPDCVTVTLHTHRGGRRDLMWELGGAGGRTAGAVRWTATIWPAARESFFAAAACELADNIDWWEAQWQNKFFLEPLLDPGTPLRPMGLLLLVLALAAKEPGESGLATDIAIRAIDDGRLGSDNFGAMLARLLNSGLVKPGRWQKALGDVARSSPVHALVVRESLVAVFRGEPAQMPRDYGKLLELLLELSAELGLGIEELACRTFLGQIGSGKTGKTAKTLLALPIDAAARPGLLQQALQRRLAAVRSMAARG